MWKYVILLTYAFHLTISLPSLNRNVEDDGFLSNFLENLENQHQSNHYGYEEVIEEKSDNFKLVEDDKFKVSVGQVGGLAMDGDNLVVFNRNNKIWEQDDFDNNNIYKKKDDGPIKGETIVKVNSKGDILEKSGANKFYMPHGFTIDKDNNYWLTDVALHQVFKMKPGQEPTLVLGKAFEPAKDNKDFERFCKPTDIAVASNGVFFVADGYCNSRILKYSPMGELIEVFGSNEFIIPHSLALDEVMDLLCVADRENEKIKCFRAGLRNSDMTGIHVGSIDDIGRVYAIEFSKNGNLYQVSGSSEKQQSVGRTIEIKHENGEYAYEIISLWNTKSDSGMGLYHPHDLTTNEGNVVYVGELFPKITNENLHKLDTVTIVDHKVKVDDNGKIEEKENLDEIHGFM